MKRRVALSLALVASVVLLSLWRSASPVQAQSAATIPVGFTTLFATQSLRITAVNLDGTNTASVRFQRQGYTQDSCSGGVCKHVVVSQEATAPTTLLPGEAASFDIPSTGSGVRGVALSNSRNVLVTAMIIDTATGEVQTVFQTARMQP
jgi:hypothetical protein